jgi:nicotinamidase-related amidase
MKQRLSKENTALLVVDVQEKLFPHIENPFEVFQNIKKAINGFRIFNLPIVVTEQYPEGLGHTLGSLQGDLSSNQIYFPKTSFSCMANEVIKKHILSLSVSNWVICGLEAHVCVFQSVRDLIEESKEVIVLNDAISSRSIYDFSTAIAEMRDYGARISSTELVLFELLADSSAKEFKSISQLIKQQNIEVTNSGCCQGIC